MNTHPPISIFALQTEEDRARLAQAAEARAAGGPAGETASGLPAGASAPAAGQPAPSSTPAASRRKWFRRPLATVIVVLAAVAVCLPVGYAAGWGNATASIEGAQEAERAAAEAAAAEPTPDQLKREENVAARLEGLGVSEDEIDRVDPDDVDPITVDPVEVEPASELARIADVDVSAGTSRITDVPVVNQLDTSDGGRALMSGCEVASLAMLLRYAGVDVTKEELQDECPTVPLVNKKGLHGNPNKAFVGDMAGSSGGAVGYSVYHGPIAQLAQEHLMNLPFKVVDLTGQSFTTLLRELAAGNPCWVITTTSMQADLVPETWETADGDILVNWALHCVVVTGYDDDHIYINDPYGYEQNVAYDRDGFERAWKLMGSQAVTIVPVD